jgi:meso-butanediol dehydrogenase / (S,S)-butanediol dehydrogenase / diacetyl reductase
MTSLAGKTAIVTGAGQGVGQGIAFALADLGAAVVAAGRTVAKCEGTVAEIESRGGQALAVECDVNSLESLQSCVDQTVAAYGGINILVNNAQQVPLGSLLEVEDEYFNLGWNSGPLATFRMMKLCHPYLKGDGSIINLASTAGRRWDMKTFGPYGAVKEAIRVLTRAAACEWGEDNIRANVILPHATSPGLKWWIENKPEEAAEFMSTIPMHRIGDCEDDIGKFVALLCTKEAGYVNGQSIALDGGQALIG